jgi:hypothetical protein
LSHGRTVKKAKTENQQTIKLSAEAYLLKMYTTTELTATDLKLLAQVGRQSLSSEGDQPAEFIFEHKQLQKNKHAIQEVVLASRTQKWLPFKQQATPHRHRGTRDGAAGGNAREISEGGPADGVRSAFEMEGGHTTGAVGA